VHDAIFFIVAFIVSMAGAALIEWIGERIGGLRSGGNGGAGGGNGPWRHGPLPPHPGPHGRGARRLQRGSRRPSAPEVGRKPTAP
jgi:hypothetical protein